MNDTFIEQVDEYVLEQADRGIIKFSDDGNLFAYMVPRKDIEYNDGEEYRINVVEIKDNEGEKLLERLHNEDYTCQFSSENLPIEESKDLSFVKKLKFDNEMQE